MPHLNLSRWAAITVIAASLLVVGCASQPSTNHQVDNWPSYSQSLQQQQHWKISAKVGVRSNSENGSAYLQWQQSPDSYQIHISGPLGQGSTWIRGNAEQVSLERAGEETIRADSAGELLLQSLGWSAPLDQLTFWIRGLPAPNRDSDIEHNTAGTLSRLSQSGWQLDYSRYQDHGNFSLPGKVIARRNDLKLTLIIKDWQLEPQL